jgi:hypothetical protein
MSEIPPLSSTTRPPSRALIVNRDLTTLALHTALADLTEMAQAAPPPLSPARVSRKPAAPQARSVERAAHRVVAHSRSSPKIT